MRKLSLFPLLALGLAANGCGGDDAAASAEQASQTDQASAAQNAQPAANSPAKPARKPAGGNFSGPDIGGLHLSMTPEDVKAAMQAYDANIKIQDTSQYFEYAALGKRYKTDSFLIATHGQLPAGAGVLAVGYSYPPQPPRVVSITRTHRQASEPLTQADYAKALIDKYGAPVEDASNGKPSFQAERILKWKLAGSGDTTCTNGVSIANSVLGGFVKDGRKMAEETITPDYAAKCDALFKYTLVGDPVTQANGVISDIAAWAASEFDARDWVQQQVDEKSKTGTEPPKL
ncbi:MAG: hypothetical protein KDA46_01440 [Parvularculaceae bacterium]|nr:hypothetical protein [Parvularculaceae bacterium]